MNLRAYRRGRIGWSVTLTTGRYLRTLWLDRARITKQARGGPRLAVGDEWAGGGLSITYPEPACDCLCHETVQPGLVPCPSCNHSSREADG